MWFVFVFLPDVSVALLAEGVDRNNSVLLSTVKYQVALLAEGVDRNACPYYYSLFEYNVALLAEGVDRNVSLMAGDFIPLPSPSSRRAWIEIVLGQK